MKKYHIFDLDGTLVDSMPHWSRKMLRILDACGIAYPQNIISVIAPLGDRATAEYFSTLGVPYTVEEMLQKMNEYAFKKYKESIRAKPFVQEYLQWLKAQGCKLYVLTASPHSMTDVCLKHNRIYELFDEVWSVDDFSAVKSSPEIYRQAAGRIGCETSDMAFYDDNLLALRAGKSAGVRCVGVYDSFSSGYEDEIRKISDQYIRAFSELLPTAGAQARGQ